MRPLSFVFLFWKKIWCSKPEPDFSSITPQTIRARVAPRASARLHESRNEQIDRSHEPTALPALWYQGRPEPKLLWDGGCLKLTGSKWMLPKTLLVLVVAMATAWAQGPCKSIDRKDNDSHNLPGWLLSLPFPVRRFAYHLGIN